MDYLQGSAHGALFLHVWADCQGWRAAPAQTL